MKKLALLSCCLLTFCLKPAGTALAPAHIWPPKVGEPYPNLKLMDQNGKRVSLASLKGKVILIEPIGMTCPACNAFSGANRKEIGRFAGIAPQQDLYSIEETLPRYGGGAQLSDDRIVYVQLLLYSLQMKAPTPQDVKRWAEHFKLKNPKNRIVLAGEAYLIGQASYDMIPGFQLVDKNFILRYDSTGHNPRHDLWQELLPAVPALLRE